MTDPLAGNPSLDEALRLARSLGCEVVSRRGTGEWSVRHERWPNGLSLNARRKDSPTALVSRLRQLMKEG